MQKAFKTLRGGFEDYTKNKMSDWETMRDVLALKKLKEKCQDSH